MRGEPKGRAREEAQLKLMERHDRTWREMETDKKVYVRAPSTGLSLMANQALLYHALGRCLSFLSGLLIVSVDFLDIQEGFPKVEVRDLGQESVLDKDLKIE